MLLFDQRNFEEDERYDDESNLKPSDFERFNEPAASIRCGLDGESLLRKLRQLVERRRFIDRCAAHSTLRPRCLFASARGDPLREILFLLHRRT